MQVLFKTSKENLGNYNVNITQPSFVVDVNLAFHAHTDLPDLMKSSKDEDDEENGDAADDDDTEEDMDLGGTDSKTSKTSSDGASSSRAKKRKREVAGERAAAARGDEADSGASPVKRRKKPLCKYGDKCYQSGSRHREQFDHPEDVGGVHKLECADIKVEEVSLEFCN